MTPLDGTGLTVTAVPAAPGTLCPRLAGDLDHESADALVRAVADRLAACPVPHRPRLDCAGLTACDSLGLAALLTIARRTRATDRPLHLDQRPPHLDRLLTVTGTRTYLVGPDTA